MPTLNINNDQVNFPLANVAVGATSSVLTNAGRGNLTINGSADSVLTLSIGGTWSTYLYSNGNGTYLAATSGKFLDLETGGGTNLRVTNGGNVLIGTTTDNGNKLRVEGTTWIAGNVFTNGEQGIELGWTGSTINDQRLGRIRPISTPAQNPYAGGLAFDYYKYDGSAYAWFEGMRLNGSGNLGIGTSTPGLKVDIVGGATLTGTANGTFRAVQDQTNYRGVVLGYDTSGQIGIIYPETPSAASTLAIWTYTGSAWGERMRVASDGNVLIGTTTNAGYKLDVNGTFRSQGVLNVQNGFYQNTSFTIAGNTTKYLYVDIINTLGNVEVLVGGYASAGTGSCVIKWVDGGHEGGTAFHRILQIARQTSGNPVLGNLIKTATGAAIMIQNTSAQALVLYITLQSLGSEGDQAVASLSDTAPTGVDSSILNVDDINNRVGVGTTSPGYLLDVNGTGRFSVVRSNYYDIPSGTGFNYFQMGADGYSGGWYVYNGTTSTYNLTIKNGGNVLIGTTTDAGYKLDVNGTGRFQANLIAGSRQYINTTLVAYKIPYNGLSIIGTTVSDSQASDGAAAVRYSSSPNDTFFYGPYTTLEPGSYVAKFRIKVGSNASGSYIGYIDVSGTNVGGTDVSLRPNMFLTGGDYYYVDVPFTCNGSASNIEFRWIDWRTGITDTYLDHILVESQASANNVYIPDGGKYTIYEAQLPRFFIANGTGNVGIGTTSPVAKLDITIPSTFDTPGLFAQSGINLLDPTNLGAYSQITFGYTPSRTYAAAYFGYVSMNSGSGGYGDLVFGTRSVTSNTQPSERMRIASSGNVLIGTTTDAGYKLRVNGSAKLDGALAVGTATPSATAGRIDASNDIVAYSSSDERLKENITPIANALEKVKSLTGVEFDWKPEYKDAHGYEGHDTGVIAQEVKEVMPSAVRENETGFLAVRYEKLIGLLIEANKELANRVEELEKKLK